MINTLSDMVKEDSSITTVSDPQFITNLFVMEAFFTVHGMFVALM